MKYTKFTALIACTIITTSAHAAPNIGDLYIAGSLGAAFTSDADYTDPTSSGSFELDTGMVFSGALGLRLTESIRAEFELSYRETDVDTLTVTGVGSGSVNGDLKTLSGMVIGYYDFDLGTAISPYLSAGVGIARHDAEISGNGVTLSNDDTVLAYQIGVGGSYAVNDTWDFTAGYRYLGSADPEFGNVDSEFDGHDVRIGFRYNF